jgi:hypothetical protein
VVVLTVGTLAAADLLPRREARDEPRRDGARDPRVEEFSGLR